MNKADLVEIINDYKNLKRKSTFFKKYPSFFSSLNSFIKKKLATSKNTSLLEEKELVSLYEICLKKAKKGSQEAKIQKKLRQQIGSILTDHKKENQMILSYENRAEQIMLRSQKLQNEYKKLIYDQVKEIKPVSKNEFLKKMESIYPSHLKMRTTQISDVENYH